MMEKKFISYVPLFLLCSFLLLPFQVNAQNCFEFDTSGCGSSIYDKPVPAPTSNGRENEGFRETTNTHAVDPDRTQRSNPTHRESEIESMNAIPAKAPVACGPDDNCTPTNSRAAGGDAPARPGGGGGQGTRETASDKNGKNGQTGNGQQQTNTTNGDVIDQERQQAEQAVAECESSAESVAGMCATDSSNSMTSGFMNMADGVARSFPTTGTGSSASACQKTADAVGAANAAMAAIKANCAMQYESCKSSCESASSTMKSISSSVKSEFSSRLSKARTMCNGAQARLNGIQQNIGQIAVASTNAQKCLQDVNATTSVKTAEQLWAECRANPASPSCAMLPQTCQNPAMATNLTCVCYNTPTSPQCTGTGSQIGSGGGGIGAGGVGAAGSAAGSSDEGWGGNIGGGGNPLAGDFQGAQLQNANIPGNSAGGGGGGGGSGANTPAPAPTGQGGGSKLNTNIIAGSRGGGGAAGFRPGGGRGGGPAREVGSYAQNGSWIPPKMDDKNQVDLNRFRPGMNDFRRPTSQTRLAEIYGPEVDIWQAINRRYIIMSPGLRP